MNLPTISTVLAELPAWGQTLAGLAILILAAWLANFVVKRLVLAMIERGLGRLGFRTAGPSLDRVARRLANVVPAVVVSRGIILVPHLPVDAVTVARNLVSAVIVVSMVLATSASLDLANAHYQHRPRAASRPIKGYVQVAKIVLFAAGAILVVAALMEQSPLLLLSGLGAMAAVLMLVFKDTILSLVASVQLTSNDMIRVGDWIEAPQFGANGDVIDIALHTVKIQNFDKTITTVPTYRLISESFRNWRGMAEAGGRRIMRSLPIDQNSVRFLSADELKALARFAHLEKYIAKKRAEIAGWNNDLRDRGEDCVNYRALTNLGTFRAYVQIFIAEHARIHRDMTQLVRQLPPGPEGLPIEIYCFVDTSNWSEYEAVQADIFDHLLAVLPHFGLRLFQRPGGMDLHPSLSAMEEGGTSRRELCPSN